MPTEMVTQLPTYLRVQADRCRRLSRSCMDLTTARDLRIMADEYFLAASNLEAITLGPARHRHAS
jgi:hypothetical protein